MNTAPSVLIKPVAPAPVQTNPFPGLRPFREDEEYLFFGRENQVDAMVDKLAGTRFLAVVGTSGSGKSSLVNCGLRPALHGGLMARAGTAWRMAQFRPGTDPLRAMARALAQDGVLFRDYLAGGLTLAEIVDTSLRMSKLGLIDIYEQANLGEDVNLLVVVDQFEELFRYRQLGAGQQENLYGVSEAATAFVNLLLEAKAQTTYPIYIVLTMRSDFLGDCTQFPGLAEAINTGQYLVPRLTRDERRAAISGPVGVGGAEISSVLLTRLVNDVGDNPDQLSILQHALNRTWARWQNEGGGKGPLDLAHYEAIGTMAHALDQHAEKAYGELATARQRQICEKLFKALTDKATDPRGVRRPTPLLTLCALADATQTEVTQVIDVFRKPSRSFLMPPAGEALAPETVIDISHESLMRVWQRLNSWADEEARSARIYRRLAETATLHAAGNASLWRDPDLQLALDWRDHTQPNETWAARYHPGFAAAIDFLTQSSEARDAERAEVEQRRRRELEAEQEKASAQAKYARRMRWAALFSVALAVIASVFLVKATIAQRTADETMAYMLFMSDQLKGLGKPYLQANLGRNLESSVKYTEDDLSKAIRARAWFLQGQAWLEQGETGDYRAALRALHQFESYRDIATQERNSIFGIESIRWVNELATAHGAIGDALDMFASGPRKCKTLSLENQDECRARWKEAFKDIENNPSKDRLSDRYAQLIFTGADGMDYAMLRKLRDESYQEARALFQQIFDKNKTIRSVVNLAGIHVTLGDSALDTDKTTANQALESYARASGLVEENLALDERRMVREQLVISAKIAAVLRQHPELTPPKAYREDYAFVADYLKSTEGPMVDYVRRLYVNPVEKFLREKGWSHEQIMDDKKRYFARWPELHFDLIEKITVEMPAKDVKILKFPIQYSTHSKERNETRSGQTRQVLELRRQLETGEWKITQDYQNEYKPE